MDDEHVHHTESFLHKKVRMVKICAGLVQIDLINIIPTGWNRVLRDEERAVYGDGQLETMPMDAMRFWQLIVHHDSYMVALCGFNSGARHAAVISPDNHLVAGQKFATHLCGAQMILLTPVNEFPFGRLQIGLDNRHGWKAGIVQSGYRPVFCQLETCLICARAYRQSAGQGPLIISSVTRLWF